MFRKYNFLDFCFYFTLQTFSVAKLLIWREKRTLSQDFKLKMATIFPVDCFVGELATVFWFRSDLSFVFLIIIQFFN